MVTEVRAKVQNLIGDDTRFALTLSDDDLKMILNKGYAEGIGADRIRDLIFAGSRISKPSTALEICDQIDFFKKILQGGLPSKFHSIEELQDFTRLLKRSFNEAGLPTGEVRIFGSSLTKPNPRNIDFCLVYSESEFENVLKSAYQGQVKEGNTIIDIASFEHADFVKLAKRIEDYPANFNSKTKGNFWRNLNDGWIQAMAGKTGPEARFGLKNILETMQENYPHLNLDDFLIIKRGAKFDRHPYIVL
jgi:hypothetical protein